MDWLVYEQKPRNNNNIIIIFKAVLFLVVAMLFPVAELFSVAVSMAKSSPVTVPAVVYINCSKSQ